MEIIRDYRLPDDEYVREETEKRRIVLHFTAGFDFHGTFEWWKQQGGRVGTAYIVDRDGKVYEVFESKYWAWALGIRRRSIEKESIQIEVVNPGILLPDGAGNLITKANRSRTWCSIEDTQMYLEHEFRGFRYFATFPKVQVNAVADLVRDIRGRFPEIGNSYALSLETIEEAKACAVSAHTNWRDKGKWDIGPAWPASRFAYLAALSGVVIPRGESISPWTTAASRRPLLERGDKGPDVLELQAWLTFRGFPLAPDGDYGPITDRAASEFRADRDLPVSDSPADTALWRKLAQG